MPVDTVAINASIDIQSIAESAGAHFRRSGRVLQSCCPCHGGDNPTAFTIFPDGSWKCFTRDECNRFGNDGIAFLQALNNWTFNEVKGNYGTPIDPKEAAKRAEDNAERITRELQETIERAQKTLEELQKARRYLSYHQGMTEYHRAMWRTQGIPDEWQNYWKFGYSPACPTYRQSPSLTIPIYSIDQSEPINVRHRLINPPTAFDKYRPETAGLAASPFYGDMCLPVDRAERVIVVEGEKKAAVLFLTIDEPLLQVIGIPGKEQWRKVAPLLEGRKDTVIIFDPDAKAEAVAMARSIGGGRVVDLPEKIDSMIIDYKLDRAWAKSIIHNARMIA